MKKRLFFLRIVFGLSFLFSAYTKFIVPGYFEITLMDQGLVNNRLAAAQWAGFFIGMEMALGILFLTPYYTRKLSLFSFFILVVFTGHLIFLHVKGVTENCGCFGEMISMTPLESIFKNGFLLSIALLLYFYSKQKGKFYWVLIVSAFFIGSMWVFLPIQKPEDLSFQSYTSFENKGRVDLNAGEKVIAVFNLDCEHCQETASKMARLKNSSKDFPQTFVLYYKEGASTVESFEKKTGFSAPYTFIDVNTFFDLIGNSPPRLYYLKNGKTVHVWDDNFVTNIKKQMDSR